MTTTLECKLRLDKILCQVSHRNTFVLNPEEENDSNTNIKIIKRHDKIRNQKTTSSRRGVTCPRFGKRFARSYRLL